MHFTNKPALLSLPTCFISVWSVRPLGGAPNYFPNSFSAPETQPQFMESKYKVSPDVARYNSSDEDNVTQVKMAKPFVSTQVLFYVMCSVNLSLIN